jgi:hypothetical protein
MMAPQVDPLGPYTPETDAALNECRDARARSAMLRKQAANAVANANATQQAIHDSVNNGIMGKVAETEGLKVGSLQSSNVCWFVVRLSAGYFTW